MTYHANTAPKDQFVNGLELSRNHYKRPLTMLDAGYLIGQIRQTVREIVKDGDQDAIMAARIEINTALNQLSTAAGLIGIDLQPVEVINGIDN
jgi:hypothetical protein